MKKLFSLILVLGLLWGADSQAIDVPIIKPGSFVELDSYQRRGKNYTVQFFDNNKCSYSYWDLWTTTQTDCDWRQEGPEVQIRMGKGGMAGRFSGSDYLTLYSGTYEYSGFLKNYTHVWKDWKSPEERKRIADEKRRIEDERLAKLEQERLAQLREKNKQNESNKNSSSGRERAITVAKEKFSNLPLAIILAGVFGVIGTLIASDINKRRIKKINPMLFGMIGAIIGLVLANLL